MIHRLVLYVLAAANFFPLVLAASCTTEEGLASFFGITTALLAGAIAWILYRLTRVPDTQSASGYVTEAVGSRNGSEIIKSINLEEDVDITSLLQSPWSRIFMRALRVREELAQLSSDIDLDTDEDVTCWQRLQQALIGPSTSSAQATHRVYCRSLQRLDRMLVDLHQFSGKDMNSPEMLVNFLSREPGNESQDDQRKKWLSELVSFSSASIAADKQTKSSTPDGEHKSSDNQTILQSSSGMIPEATDEALPTSASNSSDLSASSKDLQTRWMMSRQPTFRNVKAHSISEGNAKSRPPHMRRPLSADQDLPVASSFSDHGSSRSIEVEMGDLEASRAGRSEEEVLVAPHSSNNNYNNDNSNDNLIEPDADIADYTTQEELMAGLEFEPEDQPSYWIKPERIYKQRIRVKSFFDSRLPEHKSLVQVETLEEKIRRHSKTDDSNQDATLRPRSLSVEPAKLQRITSLPSGNLRKRQSLITLDIGLKHLHTWDFDVFEYVETTFQTDAQCHPLVSIGYSLIARFDLIAQLDLDKRKLFNLLTCIEDGYWDNPFHNALHGADVAQSICIFLVESRMHAEVDAHELLAVILAALCHDFDHPGINNQFLTNSHHVLSFRYNDVSVLENHHASSALMMMAQPENNIFDHLDLARQKSIRALIIQLIHATDLKMHYAIVNDFKNQALLHRGDLPLPLDRLTMSDLTPTKRPPNARKPRRTFADENGSLVDITAKRRKELRMNPEMRLVSLKMAIKCADLGHPAKNWNLHLNWSNRIQEEMFSQGDRERDLGLEISPFMDRNDTGHRAKNQRGFFDFLVIPMWKPFTEHFGNLKPCSRLLELNRSRWETLYEMEEKGLQLARNEAAAKDEVERSGSDVSKSSVHSGPLPTRTNSNGAKRPLRRALSQL